jgi:hypothetical protein
MNVRRCAILCATVAVIASGITPLRAQGALSLDRGSAYEMSREGAHWVSRVYVTPTPPDVAGALRVTLRSVAAGSRTDPAMTKLFPPPRRVPETGPLTAFDIITQDGASVPQGTYDVVLTVTGAAAPQALTLQMTVPAAVVAVPAALSVTRVLPVFGGDGTRALPLSLIETGGKSPVAARVVQQGRFSADGKEYNGRLTFDPATIPAGQPGQAPYRVDGDFPLGAARTTVAVTAPELAAPLSVPVEVHTRRSKALLLILVISGLALGFLMRTYLAQQVQFGELRAQAIAALRRVQNTASGAADETFRSEVERAARPLKAVIEADRSTVEQLKGAIDTAERAATEAATHLQERLTAVIEALKEVNPIVQTSWRLPAGVLEALAAAAADVKRIRAFVEAGNAGAAGAQLDATRSAIDTALIESAGTWKREARALVNALEHLAQFLLPDARARLKTALQSLSQSATDTPETWIDTAAATRLSTLKTMQAGMATARESLFEASMGVQDTWDAVERALVGAEVPDAAAWETPRVPTAEFASWLATASRDLALAPELRSRAEALAGVWRRALLAQTDDAKVVEDVSKAEYVEAAGELATVLARLAAERAAKAAAEVDDELQEDGATGGHSGRMRAASALRLVRPPQGRAFVAPAGGFRQGGSADGTAAFQVLSAGGPAPLTIEAIEARTWQQLLAARRLRWALSAIGLSIVGYLLFEEKFTGTSGDLMAAFLWGFTTDIGLDALLSARGAKPPA